MWTAKTDQTGWMQKTLGHSLGAHVSLLVLSCAGSFIIWVKAENALGVMYSSSGVLFVLKRVSVAFRFLPFLRTFLIKNAF